ncbi:MAG: hypothetical protein ABR954_06895 [Dehalococcoidales bacterium]
MIVSSKVINVETKGGRQPVIFRDLIPEIPSTTYATFGLYKYPAKFIPQVIAYALSTFGRPGMSVIDPFAGYGTVGTVARLCGNDYELWDLNPLLKHLHAVAIMRPVEIDADALVRKMSTCTSKAFPDWGNISYWYPEQFLTLLYKAWGFYHTLDHEEWERLLLIPLLKATHYFSYNDEKRQKLSRSPMANSRISRLLNQDWEQIFYTMVLKGIKQVLNRLIEYQSLKPENVNSSIRAGIDSSDTKLEVDRNILLTSPPYLQAQEYIRATKMDLYWLGYKEEYIKELGKKEFPYQDVPRFPINSKTYFDCLENIKEPHMIKLFERYFYGVLKTLTQLQEHITDKLLLFVGPATIRTIPIPLDRIFTEHFESLGWKHEITLIDTIVSRGMFFYKLNPATGKKDNRMSTEHLVVLSRK